MISVNINLEFKKIFQKIIFFNNVLSFCPIKMFILFSLISFVYKICTNLQFFIKNFFLLKKNLLMKKIDDLSVFFKNDTKQNYLRYINWKL